MRTNTGQASLELVLSATALSLTVLGVGTGFLVYWERFNCTRLAFEALHGKLHGEFLISPGNSITQAHFTFSQNADRSWTVQGRCPSRVPERPAHSESITLPELPEYRARTQ